MKSNHHSALCASHAAFRKLCLAVSVVLLVVFFPHQRGKADLQNKFHVGEFHFARIVFHTLDDSRNFQDMPPWAHDYPRADRHLLKILAEVTHLRSSGEGYQLVTLEDDQIFKYPWAYVCEVGYMNLTDKEAATLRAYLDRGGFVVVDDFRGAQEWNNFTTQMRKVYPDRGFEQLQLNHPIFQCFYNIKTLEMVPPYAQYLEPAFYGMSDEKGRLQMIVNFNNDIGEYWEWSDEGWMPISLSNEAYKYGVNYVIYALTH
ncbi:MAG: DUF4159 domain-containing protein [Acidobacteria bacterium]|nr:DUF4159 domain-containing protein [Acidobacteriota bacterium]